MPGWIQIDGKLIPKEEYHGNNTRGPSINVIGDMKPFVSPVTGEVINSRPQLRDHNKKHNVTNSADYSPEFLAGKTKERLQSQERQGRSERIELLKNVKEN